MRKLLLVGSASINTYQYDELIKGYFDEVLLLSDQKSKDYTINSIALNFSLRNPITAYQTISQIKKIISDFKPSIIHIQQANVYAFYTLLAAKSFNTPKVLTLWGSDILVIPHKSFLLKKLVQYNLLHADAITSNSKYVATEMQKLIPQKKVDLTLANLGVEITPQLIKKENIVYSNRLHNKLYRIDQVIMGFKKFVEETENASWKLIIAGQGTETENLKQLAVQLNLSSKIEFVGWQNKEQNIANYAKAKIFISIPTSDSTPTSLLEAMAYGCIPVVSNLPSIALWIENNKNGIMIDDLNSNYLKQALQLNINEVGELNKKIIVEKASKEVNRKKFLSLYDRLLL